MASVVIHVDIDIDKIKAKLDRANNERYREQIPTLVEWHFSCPHKDFR